MNDVVNMITSVGFPIAMCLLIMFFWNNQYAKTMEELRNTINRISDVVADNTKAIALLNQRLGDEIKDGEK